MATRTRPDHPDPVLRPRVYAVEFDRVWTAVERVAGEIARARVVESSRERGILRLETASVLGVRDTVELRLLEIETGDVEVDGIVESPAPLVDFGHGRRTLRQILAALDAALDHR
ncbi:MAG TPA: hypothetical protein VI997_08995 [Candidatus Thermoplasmatota archaeon]|nr:hypothetical protein [Candidatus Thermoplasmatota archaeon]